MRFYLKCLVLVSIFLTGCQFNLLSPLDSPSGDDQILSAARGCLDHGDFDCAIKLYGKLSTSYADTAASETAFALLAQYNVGVVGIVQASAGGSTSVSAGTFLNKLAQGVSGAGPAARLQIYNALSETGHITNGALKGLVRFMSGAGMAAELLAENSGNFITAAGANCAGSAVLCSTPDPACLPTSGTDNIWTGPVLAANLSGITSSQVTAGGTNASFFLLNAALQSMLDSLSNPGELGSSGFLKGIGTALSTPVANARTALLGETADNNYTNADPCYRKALALVGIGVGI